ncbi:MAG: hypothetical protein ACE5HN_07905 [Nitrospiria bacterium]
MIKGLSDKKKIRDKNIGLAITLAGLLIQWSCLWSLLSDSMFLLGLTLSVIGLALYAVAKGQFVAWCVVGLIPLIGPLSGLAVLATLHQRPHTIQPLREVTEIGHCRLMISSEIVDSQASGC